MRRNKCGKTEEYRQKGIKGAVLNELPVSVLAMPSLSTYHKSGLDTRETRGSVGGTKESRPASGQTGEPGG